jgi:hypothetical protein
MTDRVQPGAIDSIIRNDELSQIFAQFSEGWIQKANSQPTPAAVRRPEIDETALNAFSLASTSGFDITIDAGEGFVGGWCSRDVPTTITVPANTSSTIVLAWSLDAIFDPATNQNRDLADKVRVDLAVNVDSQYPSTELFDVTADGSGITGITDRRRLGPTVVTDTVEADTVEATNAIVDPEGNTVTSLSDPVRVTEEAVTFNESDISVDLTRTNISGGSISLGSKISRPTDTGADAGDSGGYGIRINPNRDLSSITVTLSTNTGPVVDVFVTDANENILDEKFGPLNTAGQRPFNAGDQVTLTASLNSGQDFHVGVFDNGNTYSAGRTSNASFPFESPALDIDTSVQDAHPSDGAGVSTISRFYAFSSVSVQSNSGDALIGFDSGVPADIDSYDLATFQRTLDNEAVTVDVEDSNGNVLFSDISQNFDISSVDTSKNVKLRANLSRTDSSNNPTVDYLARRFTR